MRIARPPQRRFLATLAAGLALAIPAGAAVVISQADGGGGNTGATLRHDFVELFNNGTAAVAIGGWSVQYASATGTSWQLTPIPAGTTLQPGRYLLVRQAVGTGGTVDVLGDVRGSIAMSGTSGKVALASNSTAFSGTVPTGAIDFVGDGAAGTAEGSPTAVLSATTAALRHGNGCSDSNGADFGIAAPAPRHAASPANLCGGTPASQPITPSCPAASVAACSATQTLQVAAQGTPGSHTLGLQCANSDAQRANCSFTVTIAGPTPIYDIQGSGATSPLAGQTVMTSGVVTKVHNNGFFLQDPLGDANALTSDAIFVFTRSAPTVSAGQRIQLSGQVAEFSTGATGANARTVTALVSPTGITVLGTGFSVTPVAVSLPVANAGDLERFEGMLVTLSGPLNAPLTVAQNFFQGRYGQLTLAAGGRLETPTNRFRPGPQAQALADENARRSILLDDGSSLQNPNPIPYLASGARAGDSVGPITGVIDHGLATSSKPGPGLYGIHPVAAPVFSSGNPRSTAPDSVGGNLKVASFNELNYFTAFIDGGGTANGCSLGGSSSTANCRGASNAAEFSRQQAKIVAALATIDADAVGLMEIQNNGNLAAQNLVNALNARVGAGTYATTSLPADTGSDAIRVAMVYKPARLAPLGAAVSDNHPINNRPTLAQAFRLANGESFTLVVNHLKSKGSCPAAGAADHAGNADSGDGQGCWNLLRTQQAQRLLAFVAERLAATDGSDALLIGDFNAYAQEDPIATLAAGGFADQVQRFNPFGYSYVFDGAAGRLDHALANPGLAAKVSRVVHWHINADEASVLDYNTEFKAPATGCGPGSCPSDPTVPDPYRSSDHDPVVVGLNLYNSTITASTSVVSGTAGDDLITAGAGRRTLSGGAGHDQFAFSADFAGGATITDFAPGVDLLNLRAVLQALRIGVADPLVSRHLLCSNSTAGDALISVDPDAAGPALARAMVVLKGVACAAMGRSSYIF